MGLLERTRVASPSLAVFLPENVGRRARWHLREHQIGTETNQRPHQKSSTLYIAVKRLRMAAEPRLERRGGLPDMDLRRSAAQRAVEGGVHKIEVEIKLAIELIVETRIHEMKGRSGDQAPADGDDPRLLDDGDQLN